MCDECAKLGQCYDLIPGWGLEYSSEGVGQVSRAAIYHLPFEFIHFAVEALLLFKLHVFYLETCRDPINKEYQGLVEPHLLHFS